MSFNGSIPNCVPEFYRLQREVADSKYECHVQEQIRFEKNREKIQDALASGLSILPYGGYSQCRRCVHADYDTMIDAEDDMCDVICYNPSCILHSSESGL